MSKDFASISWCAEDVVQNANEIGIDLSRKQAEALLRKHESRMEDAMVASGWGIIQEILLSK